VVLRDAGLPDQPLEAAARRRGAYAALDKVTAMQARDEGQGAPVALGSDGAIAAPKARPRCPVAVAEPEIARPQPAGAGIAPLQHLLHCIAACETLYSLP